jgi:hypothetical protein
MLNKDIYDNALSILAESMVEGANTDYEERAPFLLAAFCTEALDTDTALRQALDESKAKAFNPVFVSLDDEFPLLARFSPAGALYLASMLVVDEDPDLSDRLYDKYSDAMSSICATLPAACESITDRYFFD